MKRISLLLATMLLSISMAFSQNCPQISGAQFNRTGPTSFSLTVHYTGGTGLIHVMVFCASNPINGLPSVQCINVNGSGSSTVTFNCFIDPVVILVPTLSTVCGQGVPCAVPYFVTSPGQGGPVPVKIGSFYANRDNNQVKLTWDSYTEINAEKYVIERKVDGDFEVVAEVAAANEIAGSRYSYYDINTTNSTSQYRLKMVDTDGSYSYSEVRAVNGKTGNNEVNIFPNPSSGTSRVTLTEVTAGTDVQIIDHSGRVIRTISMKNTNSIELNNLQKGMYMIRVVNKETGAVVTKKLSVIN